MILRISLCSIMFGFTFVTFAQDDDTSTNEVIVHSKPATKEDKQYQMKTVKGIILDQATKTPLAGIQIKTLENNRYTTMSDEDGLFTIIVPVFSTSLYVYAPQYLSQQVAIGKSGGKTLKILLLSDKYKRMYDNGNKIIATNSFASYASPSITIDGNIQSQLGSDIRSIQRSAAPAIGNAMFIRGLNSLNSNSQPLIVIDGVEQDMQQNRLSLHSGQFNNMLVNISPCDIDKVTVLKNATALFGARGANGVILIETKRGHNMATRIDADLSIGCSFIPKLPTVMNASQYRTYATEMLGTISTLRTTSKTFNFLDDNPLGYYYHVYHNNTDWTKEVYQNAMTQNYNINVQGGDDIGMYNLSVGYSDAQSTAKKNDFNRMNVRFNTDINIIHNLSTKFDISISRTSSSVFDDGATDDFTSGTITSPTFLALIKSPLISPRQYNQTVGHYTELLSGADDLFEALGSDYSLANPTAILENGYGYNKNIAENINFHTLLEPKYEINHDLILMETFNYSLNRNSQRYSRPYEGVPSFDIEGLGTVTSMTASLFSKEINVMSNTHLDYKHIFGAHSINTNLGFRYNYFSFDDNNLSTEYTGSTNDKNPSLSASSGYQNILGDNDVWKILQWYGNINYNYMNRYFVSLSLLGEANSRFGSDCDGLSMFGVKWGLFPSVQTGWVLTNENWFPKTSVMNYLRVNAGFDISGNDDISNYAAKTSFSAVKFNYHATGLQLTNIGNNKVQWEATTKFNLGFQSYWLNNRLGVAFDVFNHKTSNLLTLKSFSNPIGGINQYWSNGGELENRGFELTITNKPIISKNWNVEVGVGIAHYKNKVTKLPDGDYTSSIYGDDNILTSVGNPVALFYGYKTQGVFSTDAEAKAAGKNGYLTMEDEAGVISEFKAGDVHFVDLNNDGEITEEDKTVIGNPNPDIYGNIFASVNWKNITLNLSFNYSIGNDVYNYQRSILNSGSTFYNQQVSETNHWRYEGQITNLPKLAYGDPMGNNRFSDRWIEDGSYLRLKTLNVSYRVPVNNAWLQGLSIWIEATNLFTITKYLGSDPEFSISNNVLYQGIDCGNLSQGRMFTLGVKVNL